MTQREPVAAACLPQAPITCEADIAAAVKALGLADPRLGRVIEIAGPVPLRRNAGGLRGLAGIVVAQQVSKASADAIFGRLASAVDLNEPQALLAATDETFRFAGLSRPKQRTLLAIASAAASGDLDFDRVADAPAALAIAELTAIRGIGVWTAECYLLFCAGHPDIFPAGDLALASAVSHAFGHTERLKEKALFEIADAWAPHRSSAARLFWTYYHQITRRDAAPAPA